MGSADLMTRIDHRVEVVFPIENVDQVRQIRQEMLETYLKDNMRARSMHQDGTYTRLKAKNEDHAVDVQEFFMTHSRSFHWGL